MILKPGLAYFSVYIDESERLSAEEVNAFNRILDLTTCGIASVAFDDKYRRLEFYIKFEPYECRKIDAGEEARC